MSRLFERLQQPQLFQIAGTHCSDVPAGLHVSKTNQVQSRCKLRMHGTTWLGVSAKRLELKAQASETLRKSVVQLHGESLPFCHDSMHLGSLHGSKYE